MKASSLNPIDKRMTEGYGDQVLSTLKHMEKHNWNPILIYKNLSIPSSRSSRLPLIVGRDFSAEVVLVGSKVSQYKPGDEVSFILKNFLAKMQFTHFFTRIKKFFY